MLFLSGGCVGFLLSHPHRKEEINFNPLEASVLSEKTEAYRCYHSAVRFFRRRLKSIYKIIGKKEEGLLVLEPIN
jgi:hypothetical protein